MFAKKIKTTIGSDRRIILYVPDIPLGEVEIIIIGEQRQDIQHDEILTQLPRRKLGKISGTLRREEFYTDAR